MTWSRAGERVVAREPSMARSWVGLTITVIQFSMEELTGGNRGAIKRFDPLEGARAKALLHTSQNALMELER